MADKLGELVVEIVADNKKFDSGIDKSKKQTEKFKGGLDGLSGTVKKLLGAGALIAVASKIKDIGIAATNAASEALETRTKFNTAFKGIETDAIAVAENLSENYGLARTESEKLLSSTGDLIKGFGANATQALGTSETIQKLSVDLADYNTLQGGASRASEILTKAYLGERDSLVSLGIKISENDVKQRLLEKGQENLTGQALLLAKGNATLELAIGQSGDAIGSFARSAGSYEQATIKAEAATKDLQVELGRTLLPTATSVKSIFGDLTGRLADYIREINNLREAEKALEAGKATREQELLVLKERQEELVKTIENQKESLIIQEKTGQGNIKLTTEAIQKNEIILNQIKSQIVRTEALGAEEEKLRQKKLLAEEEEKKAAQAREEQNRIDQENYKASLTAIENIINANKTQIEVIDSEIESLESLEVKDEETRVKQLEAIRLLQEEKQKLLDEEEKAKEDANKKEIEDALELADKSLEIIKARDKKIIDQEKETQEKIRRERLKTLDNSFGIAGSLIALAENVSEQELASGKKTAEEKYKADLAIFNARKALAAIEIAVNTAVQASTVIANPFLFASTIALGATQAAVVLSQPEPPKPQLATGAFIDGSQRGTQVIVGEGGNDEEIFGMGSKGVPRRAKFANEVADIVLRKQQAQPIINKISVEIDKQPIYDIINEGIDSQNIRITSDNIQGGI